MSPCHAFCRLCGLLLKIGRTGRPGRSLPEALRAEPPELAREATEGCFDRIRRSDVGLALGTFLRNGFLNRLSRAAGAGLSPLAFCPWAKPADNNINRQTTARILEPEQKKPRFDAVAFKKCDRKQAKLTKIHDRIWCPYRQDSERPV